MDCVGVVGAWDRGFGVIPFEALGGSVQNWGAGDLGHRPGEGEQMGFLEKKGGQEGERGAPEHGLTLPFSGPGDVLPHTQRNQQILGVYRWFRPRYDRLDS